MTGSLHDEVERRTRTLLTARSYVLVLRPILLAFTVVAMTSSAAAHPATVDPTTWIVIGAYVAVQLAAFAGLALGVPARVVASATFVADTLITSSGLFTAAEPIGTSALMTFCVVAASFFLPGRVTVLLGAIWAAEITVASHVSDGWGDSLAFPNTAFVVLGTGILSATLVSRIRRTEQHLQVALAEQLEARRDLERVARVRDRLIANVSHELRTPLTATLSSIETLMREDIDLDRTARAELLGLAQSGGHRLLSLVEDLLTLGVTRPDAVRPDPEPAALARLVREAIRGIDPGDTRMIRLIVREDPRAVVDARRIEQVVGNLVSNAVEHGAGDVVVELDTDTDGGAVARVRDEGPGVATEHLDELFLPFARFSDRPDSTGLGLAISRSIVEAHGGTLTYGRTDGWTCFTLALPAPEAVA